MDILYADAGSAEAILALQKLAYQSEAQLYNDFSIPPLRQTLDELIQEITTQTVLQAVEGSTIIGSVRAFLTLDVCYIGRLIVHPAYQGRGIGTTLMSAIESCFPTAARYELFTGARSEANIRLYQRLGYEIFQTKPINDQLTMVYMTKRGA